jgi:hypothetical protein
MKTKWMALITSKLSPCLCGSTWHNLRISCWLDINKLFCKQVWKGIDHLLKQSTFCCCLHLTKRVKWTLARCSMNSSRLQPFSRILQPLDLAVRVWKKYWPHWCELLILPGPLNQNILFIGRIKPRNHCKTVKCIFLMMPSIEVYVLQLCLPCWDRLL